MSSMNWNKKHIRHIVADMAEENFFACRALLGIADIVFTGRVETLAVSISERPVLMINRGFLDSHAVNENDVKALLMHEFLHVILRHTEKFEYNTPVLNIALDAVINAIIHRTMGSEYSGIFCRLYDPDGITCLLRTRIGCKSAAPEPWTGIHQGIYSGRMAADDLYELMKYIMSKGDMGSAAGILFVGNHDPGKRRVSDRNRKILDGIVGRMNGTGIWNSPRLRGSNGIAENRSSRVERLKLGKWRSSVFRILERCMMEDQSVRDSPRDTTVMMPVISVGDRRAFASQLWSEVIPFAANRVSAPGPRRSVNIYLDVSGSMDAEIGHVISLLHYFREHIRMPLWVFSDRVEKAVFRGGQLDYESTGGTTISCVFDHIRSNRSGKNVIVTDGYVETITPDMLSGINTGGLHVILSAGGNATQFHNNRIKYFRLQSLCE